MIWVWNLQTSTEHAQNMSGTGIDYAWNTIGICTEHVWKLSRCAICMKSELDMLGACLPGPRPPLTKPVCRLCVVSVPRERGDVLASNCGRNHVGNLKEYTQNVMEYQLK